MMRGGQSLPMLGGGVVSQNTHELALEYGTSTLGFGFLPTTVVSCKTEDYARAVSTTDSVTDSLRPLFFYLSPAFVFIFRVPGRNLRSEPGADALYSLACYVGTLSRLL
jgi:hypothetical protein